MQKSTLLFTSIMLAILTTSVLGASFCLLNPTGTNLFIISMISLAGYLTSYVYFLTYKEQLR